MSIKIKIGQVLRQFVNNQDTIEVSGSTIIECLDDLAMQFPDIKEWLFDRNCILRALILFNGEAIGQKGLTKPVADGDELQIFLIVGGG